MAYTDYEREIILLSKLDKRQKIALMWYVLSEDKPTEKVIDAYRFSRNKEPNSNDDSAYQLGRKWIKTEPCSLYIAKLKDRFFSKKAKIPGTETLKLLKEIDNGNECQNIGNEYDTEVSREETIKILSRHLRMADARHDSKLVDDISARLEAIKFKKEGTDAKDEQIRRYMPLKCENCVLFLREKKQLVDE